MWSLGFQTNSFGFSVLLALGPTGPGVRERCPGDSTHGDSTCGDRHESGLPLQDGLKSMHKGFWKRCALTSLLPPSASAVPQETGPLLRVICLLAGGFQLLTAHLFLGGVIFSFPIFHLERWQAEALNFPPPAPLTWPCSVPVQAVKGKSFISISKGKQELSAWPCADSGRVSSEDEWG